MRTLVVLALRRTLPGWALLAFVALLLLAARANHGAGLDAGPVLDERQAAGLRALARQDVWSVLLVLAPLLFFHAARLGGGACRTWLAPAPAAPLWLGAALVLGATLACALVTLLTAGVAEARVEAHPGWRRVRTAETPRAARLDAGARVAWSIEAPEPGARLCLWLTVAPGAGPAASARFTARAGGAKRTVEARVAGRTALELEPPPGARLELELEHVGAGAPLVIGTRGLELLAPLTSERQAALALGARAGLLLASGCALALGLGSLLRPALAAGLVLALGLGAWTRARAPAAFPGADLPQAFAELASGLVPAPLAPAALVGALIAATGGLALFALSFGRARGGS